MTRRFAPLLVLFPALLFFWNLGYATFWNPDEGRYASASYEMAFPFDGNQPDWIVPHLNTLTRLNKPPLVYWLSATSFRLFGVSEVSGRLPSALAAFSIAFIIFWWGRLAFGTRAGMAGALVWCTSVFPYAMARVLNTDMQLTFTIALASFGVWLAFKAKEEGAPNLPIYKMAPLIAGSGMGLALLSKGPVGVAFPLAIGFMYLIVTKSWARAPWVAIPLALVVACVIGLPWYFAAQSRFPDFLQFFLGKENVSRLTGKGNFHDAPNPFYYLPVCIAGLLPWTAYLFTTFSGWAQGTAEKKARTFLWAYALTILGVFTLSQTKLISYALPAFPALALLLGTGISRWETQANWRRTASVTCTFLIYAGLAIGSYKFLVNEKVFPLAEGLAIHRAIIITMLMATAALIWVSLKPNAARQMGVQALTAVAIFGLLLNVGSRMSPREDGSALYQLVKEHVQPDTALVGYGLFEPNLPVYARRPVYFFGFKNTSGLQDKEIFASPYFPDYRLPKDDAAPEPVLSKLVELYQKRPHMMVFSNRPLNMVVDGKERLHKWGMNNDLLVYATWPKPVDLNLDLSAPNSRLMRKLKG